MHQIRSKCGGVKILESKVGKGNLSTIIFYIIHNIEQEFHTS